MPLFHEAISEVIGGTPDFSRLGEKVRERVSVREGDGGVEIVYAGPPIGEEEAEMLKRAVGSAEDKKAVERLVRKSRGQECSPAALGEKLEVPWLSVRVDEERELFEDQFREVSWKLSDCDALLAERDFSLRREGERVASIDVDKAGKIGYSSFVSELQKELALLELHGPGSKAELTVWLDQHIRHPDIAQTEGSLFLGKMVSLLIEKRGYMLEELVSNRWRLRDAGEELISHHRRQVVEREYQRMLLPECETPVEVDPTFCFMFEGSKYPATRFYEGPVRFKKHYYLNPASMNGEEAECAAFIDGLDEVEYWVKNLERSDYSFWLQTSSDKFYPDFVVRLKDGRILVVEYKGAPFVEMQDTKEKHMIGEVWAARSGGRCLFRLVGKTDYQEEIEAAIGVE